MRREREKKGRKEGKRLERLVGESKEGKGGKEWGREKERQKGENGSIGGRCKEGVN